MRSKLNKVAWVRGVGWTVMPLGVDPAVVTREYVQEMDWPVVDIDDLEVRQP